MNSHPVRDVLVALIIGVTVFNCVDIATRNSPEPHTSRVWTTPDVRMLQDEIRFCKAEVTALRELEAPKK